MREFLEDDLDLLAALFGGLEELIMPFKFVAAPTV